MGLVWFGSGPGQRLREGSPSSLRAVPILQHHLPSPRERGQAESDDPFPTCEPDSLADIFLPPPRQPQADTACSDPWAPPAALRGPCFPVTHRPRQPLGLRAMQAAGSPLPLVRRGDAGGRDPSPRLALSTPCKGRERPAPRARIGRPLVAIGRANLGQS